MESQTLPPGLSEYDENQFDPIKGIGEIAGHAPKFVSEFQSPDRFMIRFYRHKKTLAFYAKVWFGHQCEGPPGTVHGGAVAAVLDEAMGQASWIAGFPVLAASITVNFRARVVLNEIHELHATINKQADRKVFVEARLLNLHGEIMADSTGLFIRFPQDSLTR